MSVDPRRPLAGQTILVTRPARQTDGLREPLEALGATVYALPAIEIAPPDDMEAFDAALWDIDRFDWLVFTSVNGVLAVRDRMDALGMDRRASGRTKIAAVGPATEAAVREGFGEPAAMPSTFVSDAVADAMGDVRQLWVLLARADIARREIVDILRERGAIVEEVTAYRIVRAKNDAPLPDACPDWIALTSSQAVHGTREALAARGYEDWMREARLACIGPVTATTVRELDLKVGLMAEEATIPGLVRALAREAAVA